MGAFSARLVKATNTAPILHAGTALKRPQKLLSKTRESDAAHTCIAPAQLDANQTKEYLFDRQADPAGLLDSLALQSLVILTVTWQESFLHPILTMSQVIMCLD